MFGSNRSSYGGIQLVFSLAYIKVNGKGFQVVNVNADLDKISYTARKIGHFQIRPFNHFQPRRSGLDFSIYRKHTHAACDVIGDLEV